MPKYKIVLAMVLFGVFAILNYTGYPWVSGVCVASGFVFLAMTAKWVRNILDNQDNWHYSSVFYWVSTCLVLVSVAVFIASMLQGKFIAGFFATLELAGTLVLYLIMYRARALRMKAKKA